MGSRSFWLRILNVYPEEWGIVRRLYVFQFFQGSGIAFFFTGAFSRFLERFPITRLPWVMIYSALLLWITGLVYTRLEHAIKFSKFNVLIIVVMAVSILLLWLTSFYVSADWFFFLVLAWFEVLYLLNNMEFWGIAALLFDLRQSKRLFAVISAGDIPAKFIGYTLAWVFVPYTGTQNLLLIGAGCILASLTLFKGIVRTGMLEVHNNNHHHHKHGKHTSQKITKIVENIATNTYIRRIAFISLITSTCVILINYGFYGEVKKAFHDDVALAEFVAFFYAGLRLVAFVIKLIFTSRLTSQLGIRGAMFVTPVGMFLLILIITLVNLVIPGQMLIFYLFGFASMLIDVLRTSLNSPVLLTIMQPLPTNERLRAHNIVKGIMDPFASFLSGVFLLTIFYMYDRVDLMLLCYILMALGILWIIGVFVVNRHYFEILFKTIGKRYFGSEGFNLKNEAILDQIKNKLTTGSDVEVINILRLLNNKEGTVAEDLITELLNHPSDQVKLEVLRLLRNRPTEQTKGKLESFLHNKLSLEVKSEAIKTICKIGKGDWELAAYLADPHENIRTAAMTGMLGNDDARIKAMAESAIRNLLISEKNANKEIVISVLSEVKNEYESPAIIQLINDADPETRKKAIKAVGTAAGMDTLVALFSHIHSNEKLVLGSLYNAGAKSLPLLKEFITRKDLPDDLQEKLIILCGKIGGEEGQKTLLELLKIMPQQISVVIKALHRSRYKADGDMQVQLEAIARTYIINGVELLYMQRGLEKNDSRYEVLNSSLNYEIEEIREVLLCLFGCIYDREKINHAKFGLDTTHKESIANAMEIIELTVKKDLGRQFNNLFEITSIEQRCNALGSLFTGRPFSQVEHILERILSEKPVHYYSWTKACSMYISRKYAHPLTGAVYKKYIESENRLLKETALFASVIS
jgi:ATP:ADP antiporter, AAA family